ncbi:Hint domain-containing protein [Yoonia sp. GPGPB17]|uniref:Hint domain-containing protein n=1 Tax=Yoonia sp. GPGPB17 TaxID=3026147 RepID=UPI0030BEDFF4
MSLSYDASNNVILTIEDGPLLNDDVLDGDFSANEVGIDPDQFGVATFAGGGTVGSLQPGSETTVYSETEFELTAPGQTTIMLFQIEIEGQLVGFLPTTPLVPGVVYSYVASNTVPGPGNETLYDDIVGAVCFTQGTLIETPEGQKPIEVLCEGDAVKTQDGIARIRWIGSRKYGAVALSENPKLLPIRICAGALGHGLPLRDLWVSRQHWMLVSSKIVERVCGTTEALIAAIKLTKVRGILVDENAQEVEYYHMLFDRHEIVFAEGAPSESLFTGPEAMKSLSSQARNEILTIFPELRNSEHQPSSACTMPPGSTQKVIVERHQKNNRPLLQQYLTG